MSWANMTDGVMKAATQTFGETVTYTPSGGSPFTISGIFRDQFLELDVEAGYEVLVDKPNLGVRNSDFENPPAQDDTLVRAGKTYKVKSTHKDGEAGTILELTEVTA